MSALARARRGRSVRFAPSKDGAQAGRLSRDRCAASVGATWPLTLGASNYLPATSHAFSEGARNRVGAGDAAARGSRGARPVPAITHSSHPVRRDATRTFWIPGSPHTG